MRSAAAISAACISGLITRIIAAICSRLRPLRAEKIRPGSQAALEGKALQLMGGANSPAPAAGDDVFAWNIREGRADLFIAYCSGGQTFKDRLRGSNLVALPADFATGADYGLTVLSPTTPAAARLAFFMLSQDGQMILARNGFIAPLLSDAVK